MTSFYNSNANAASKSVVGVTPNSAGAANIEAAKDFFRFQQLYNNALNLIKTDLGYFSTGNFDSLSNALAQNANEYLLNIYSTQLYYNESIDNIDNLNKLIRDPNVFEGYIIVMQQILDGLNKGVALQNTNNILTYTIEQNKLGNGIPLDEETIQTFLNNRKTEFIPFAEKVIYRQDNLDIKIWYATYLQQEGPPPNGLFNINILSAIVNDLIVKGVITLDDFISEETYTTPQN
jgi:hypothetical protein